MMNIEVGPYFDRCLAALAVTILLGSSCALAQASSEFDEHYDPNGLVEVHLKADINAPYSERKSNWSYRFNAGWENFMPSSYVSPIDSASYATAFGSNVGSLFSGSFGVQYNTGIGGFYVDGIYGMGTIQGVAATDSLKISKYGASFGYMLDVLGKSPWVSPFVGGQVLYLNWTEASGVINKGGTTDLTVATMAGIAIHLDKLDPDAARDAYVNYGIKNAFIDIFGIQYNTSNNAADPDLQTAWNVGAGFHLEF